MPIHVLYFDPNIAFYSVYRQYYFVPMLLLNLLFVFLPMLFLLLYPTRVCRRVIHCVCSGRMRSTLFLFMDNFQGCYKNGTAGTYDYRSASCLGFVLRLVMCWILSLENSNNAHVNDVAVANTASLLIVTSLFYSLVRPYKKKYMNIVESLLYAMAVYLLISILHHKQKKIRHYVYHLTILLMPSVVFLGVLIYKALKALGIITKVQNVIDNVKPKKCAGVEIEPDRLVNPTEYTHLINKQ